jgi:hypothetical protein
MNLSLTPEKTHLNARITGAFQRTGLCAMLQDIFQAAVLNKQEKVLIDVTTVTGSVSNADRIAIAEAAVKLLPENQKYRLLILAMVGTKAIIDPHPEPLGETIARNRGVMIKVTTNMAEAMKWLDISPSQEQSATSIP